MCTDGGRGEVATLESSQYHKRQLLLLLLLPQVAIKKVYAAADVEFSKEEVVIDTSDPSPVTVKVGRLGVPGNHNAAGDLCVVFVEVSWERVLHHALLRYLRYWCNARTSHATQTPC